MPDTVLTPHAPDDEQLRTSIRLSLTSNPRRPLLHFLNGDSSWLLQIPQPATEASRFQRPWYNILIDPWLQGDHVDYYKWFSQQWHAHEPAYPDIRSVETLIERVELLTRDLQDEDNVTDCRVGDAQADRSVDDVKRSSKIDVILISFEFTDHCHQATLLQVDSSVPVFATTNAASIVKSWNHFASVTEVPRFFTSNQKDTDWRSRSQPPLPRWLSFSRFVAGPLDVGDLHSALLIAFDNETAGQVDDAEYTGTTANAIIYTPHGIESPRMEALAAAEPPLDCLALMHGTNVVRIAGGLVNRGAKNGLELQRLLKARYWLRTHDGENVGKGVVARTMTVTECPVEQAIKEYQKEHEGEGEVVAPYRHLGNGDCFVLQ